MAKDTRILNFPQNRKFRAYLRRGDYQVIATKTGLSTSYISEIFQGFKRMTPKVFAAAKPIIEANKELEKALQHG